VFERAKAYKIVLNTIKDVKILFNELALYGVYPNANHVQVECLYIALVDYLLFLNKKSDLGDCVVDVFIQTRIEESKEEYHRDIVTTHKEYHRILKEALTNDDSPNGMVQGYKDICDFIARLIMIDSNNTAVASVLESILFSRHEDCKQ